MGGFYFTGFFSSSVISADGQNGGGNRQIIQPVFVGVKMIELFVGLLTNEIAMGKAWGNLRVLNFYLKHGGV